MVTKCPIRGNTLDQCPVDCEFHRNEGCAVIVSMQTSISNEKKIDDLLSKVKILLDKVENISA